jgi:hypothetical protein
MSSKQQQLRRNYDKACFLWGYSEGKEETLGLPDIMVLFLQLIFRYSCFATSTTGHWRKLSQKPAYSTMRAWLLLTLSFASQISLFFLNSFYIHITFYSWSKHIVWNHHPNFNIVFMRKSHLTAVQSTPLKHIMISCRGMNVLQYKDWVICWMANDREFISSYYKKHNAELMETNPTLSSYQGFWQWYITLRITRFLDYDNHFISKTCSFNTLIYHHCENRNTSNSHYNAFILIWDYGQYLSNLNL